MLKISKKVNQGTFEIGFWLIGWKDKDISCGSTSNSWGERRVPCDISVYVGKMGELRIYSH